MREYNHLYPVMIRQDRYGGAYSKGPWLAVANFWEDRPDEFESGPMEGDINAANFWWQPPAWIAVGNTPDEALAALIAKNPGKRLHV